MQYKSHEYGAESSNSFAVKIETLVREIIIQNEIPYYRIESGSEEDLPVIRIITYFEDTANKISQIIHDEFDVDIEESPGNKNALIETFAYKNLNYTAALTTDRQQQTEYKRWGDKKFDIQVSSMLQDAWTGIEKALGGDSNVPDEAKRDLYRIGALLEMADIEFLKIRTGLNKNTSTTRQPDIAKTEAPREAKVDKGTAGFVERLQAAAKEVQKEVPVAQHPAAFSPPSAEPATKDTTGDKRPGGNGSIQKAIDTMRANAVNKNAPLSNEQPKPANPVQTDENALISEVSLKDYVLNSKLVKELDQKIAQNAGAKINAYIDIEGDVERLQFLKVLTLKQLNDRITDNKDDIIAFAEKWIGKDHGGSFDSGICLFYMEYLLVAKRNDPAFSSEYVVKFISDNDYSARYIIHTYNSIRNTEVPVFQS